MEILKELIQFVLRASLFLVVLAILLMAMSPLPPFMPGKEVKPGGRKPPYVYGLLVAAVSMLAIVIVPVSVAILSAVFATTASIAPGAVAGMVLSSVLLPLAVGMVIGRIRPQRAEQAAPGNTIRYRNKPSGWWMPVKNVQFAS